MEQTLSERARSLLAYIEEQGYVCPWGEAWHKLWKMLREKRRVDAGWEPPPPLILAGWYSSSNLQKSFRLRQHIEWADQYGVIDKVDSYLRALDRTLWHTWKNSCYPCGDG